MLKLLQTNNDTQNLDAAFVLTIGSFVRDMRLVKNIFNEYLMYKDKIGIEAEYKLLGMIAYKNIYPEDFSALHDGKGMIHDVFANKAASVIQRSSDINADIEELELRVAKLEIEIAQNRIELNSIYVLKIIEMITDLDRIHIGNDRYLPSELTEQSLFDKLRTERTIKYNSHFGQRSDSQIAFSRIEQRVDENRSYEDRLDMILSRESLDLGAARRLLASKIAMRDRLQSLSLLEHLKSIPMVDFNSDVAKQPLLVFLLESGAIDELYQLYISNFYEGALKRNDQLFLIDVKTKTSRNPDYKLVNIEEMIKRLSVDDFTRPEILNFDLTEHLSAHRSRYHLQLGALSDQLNTSSPEVWTFVKSCLAENKLTIFEVIPDLWPNFWRDLMIHYKDLDELQITYLSILLMLNTPQRLIMLNEDNILSNFVTTYFTAIRKGLPNQKFSNTQRRQIASGVEDFVDITETKVHSIDAQLSLSSPVYINNRYSIALHNFETLLSAHASENYNNLIHNGVLTRIFESELEAMKDYCQKHISEVIELLFSKGQIEMESPKIAIQILKDPALSIEQKQCFVETIDFRLTEIVTFSTDSDENDEHKLLINTVLASRKFDLTWKNILNFYETLGMNGQLTNLLNDLNISAQGVELFDSPLPSGREEAEPLSRFSRTLAESEAISDSLYLRLVPLLSLMSKIFLEVTPKNRLAMLIERGVLPFDQDHLSFFDEDNELLNTFLLHNLDKFDQVQLTAKHFESIISPTLSDAQKQAIGNAIITARMHNNARLIDAVAGYIESGLIVDPGVENLKDVLQSSISDDRKVGIFKIGMKTYPYNDLIGFLPLLGWVYERLNTGTTYFDIDLLDLEILTYLKMHGFIANFIVTDEAVEIQRLLEN